MSTHKQTRKDSDNPVSRGRHERQCQNSKRETGELMGTGGGPAPVCPMARPERFGLPTFWFVVEFHPLHPTTPANQTQQNNRKRYCVVASLWPVPVALHGQKTDRGEATNVMSSGDAR